MAKLEARTLTLEAGDAADVNSFNSRTGAVTLQLGDISGIADSRYVLKTGDTMTGSLFVRVAAADSFVSIHNALNPTGAEGSGGAATLHLVSLSLASFAWSISADGGVDRLLFQDGGFNTRMWIQASTAISGGTAFGIGSPVGGVLPVLLHNAADGRLLLTNKAGDDFSRLQFGGITSLFPALKRTATVIEAVLADDSARAQLYAATIRTTQTTVAGLPAAATAGAGARAFVTNATATKTAGDGTIVAGGGANIVPVYSDGTNWIIG